LKKQWANPKAVPHYSKSNPSKLIADHRDKDTIFLKDFSSLHYAGTTLTRGGLANPMMVVVLHWSIFLLRFSDAIGKAWA
jgi:hypothetical protein